jgi:proteasome accessory factor C
VSGPRTTEERLRRLLVMLPWLMERGEVPLAEVAQRFAIDPRDVVKDLELVALCGLPPFVDEMIDVFVDEGVVYTGVPRVFTGQLRLSAPEAFALLAASRTAMEVQGADPNGPLARALNRLSAALQQSDDGGLVVDAAVPAAVEPLRDAAADGAVTSITYRGAADDTSRQRSIVPRLVFADGPFWYVIADDLDLGEERTFRADRIDAVEVTADRRAQRAVRSPIERGWFAGAELPVATIEVPADRWSTVDYLPTRAVRVVGDCVHVTLVVLREAWLDALLLRLGPDATIIEPAEWGDRAAAAARRLLYRYEQVGEVGS